MRSTLLLVFLGVVAACGGRQVTNESTSDNNPPATSGSGGTASTSAGSGGTVAGAAGTLGAAGDLQPPDLPPTRCSFRSTTMPTMGKPLPGPLVQMRIVRFITGSDGVVPADTPDQVTPQWAADSASKLLDSFGGASSAAPGGFVQWLAQWSLGKAPLSASRWANVMAQPSATLSSLIAAPNPDNAPHGVGYMTDKEILTRRHSIDTRGMMVLDHLLCVQIPPPPANIVLPAPTPMPGVTDRQAHAAILSNPSCAGCHRMINPFGHAFEHFDAMGAYRDLDNGLPIDSSDVFQGSDGVALQFTSIEDLAPQLATSCEVARCIATSLMREAIPQEVLDVAAPTFTDDEVLPVAEAFANSGFSMRALVRAIVSSPAFLRYLP